RYLIVTGVQTCALPILSRDAQQMPVFVGRCLGVVSVVAGDAELHVRAHDLVISGLVAIGGDSQLVAGPARELEEGHDDIGHGLRSEERRVGKERRDRWM